MTKAERDVKGSADEFHAPFLAAYPGFVAPDAS